VAQPAAGAPAPSWFDEHVFLRRNLKDLGSFEKPSSLEKAAGAEFSWSNDGVQKNRAWSTQGLLGIGFSEWGKGGDILQRGTFGAYVEWQRLSNSKVALKSKNIDDLKYGLSSDVGVGDFLGATHYFTSRGELLSNFDSDLRNWNLALEYQPYGLPLSPQQGENTIFNYMSAPLRAGWFVVTVSPKLRVEYRGSLDGSKDPIFATDHRVLRAGPAVGLSVVPYIFATDAPVFVKRMSFQFWYGYLHDFISHRDYRLIDTSLTYNFDDAANYATTVSYNRGELETTGQKVDLFKISLSAKFGDPAKSQ
jgi:hypothetical protein